ncbi:hypothetical protein PR202_ga07705 [Eleusine coracana subsp. coracana]|uniref:RING-type E3 ubiquitin transferase n=1 Tax=Eleusine coracana subsp. coracana TaxID=191504 RepID=A0AAV5BZE7_ELECO|nr:hypothetical protein PR202_ga07705 [Eleusine coracana subsp. coracana]
MLCALICVIGLAAAARCARSRRNRDAADGAPASPTGSAAASAAGGLKKKALKALPKLAYADAEEGRAEEVLSECAICLSEFGEREEVRVMPQCGHGFHVACVDTWLRSNSSCPSCRRPIVLDDPAPPKRCRKCEAIVEAVVASSSSSSSSAVAGSSSSGSGGRRPPRAEPWRRRVLAVAAGVVAFLVVRVRRAGPARSRGS